MGIYQQHTYWLYKVIDDVLNENKQIKGIVEIGTGLGALSIFLGLECYERNLKPLLTYDIKQVAKPRLFDLLNIKAVARNCFDVESVNEIMEYIKEPVLFICDGGNKIKEFNFFAYLLPEGSIITAHDWDDEIRIDDVRKTVMEIGLKPLHKDDWVAPPDYIAMSFWKILKKGDNTMKVEDIKQKKKSVYMATPTTGTIRTELARFLLMMTKNPYYRIAADFAPKGDLCHNRNLLVKNFLEKGFDYILFIDSDVVPPLNIMNMVEDGKDVVSAVNYIWSKFGTVLPLIMKESEDKTGYKFHIDAAGSKENIVEVEGVGTGCLLVKREVFLKIQKPYFEFSYDKDGLMSCSEDYNFCKKCRKAGYKIFVDKRFVTEHYSVIDKKSINDAMVKMAEKIRSEKE